MFHLCTEPEKKKTDTENIKIGIFDDKISTMGNYISENDSIASIHPKFSKESEDIISDTLGVKVFKTSIANKPLVGTYSAFKYCTS